MAARLPIYCPSDVARHSSAGDAWVSLHGKVLDVSPLLNAAAGQGDLALPLIAAAGTDVSGWFTRDADGTLAVRTFVDPVTSRVAPYLPQGRFPHVPPPTPVAPWAPEWGSTPWWVDDAFLVGSLTARSRRVRIVNTLAGLEHELDVGCEQTLREVADKFTELNAHAHAYVWKALRPSGAFEALDMGKTLAENGVEDESEELAELGLDAESRDMLPALLLFFKDDLTTEG